MSIICLMAQFNARFASVLLFAAIVLASCSRVGTSVFWSQAPLVHSVSSPNRWKVSVAWRHSYDRRNSEDIDVVQLMHGASVTQSHPEFRVSIKPGVSLTAEYSGEYQYQNIPTYLAEQVRGGNGIILTDDKGQVLQVFEPKGLLLETVQATIADPDHSGKLQIAVLGHTGRQKSHYYEYVLFVMDKFGKVLWQCPLQHDGEVAGQTDVLHFDLDGDGVEEWVCLLESGQIGVISGEGELLARISVDKGAKKFAVMESESSHPLLCVWEPHGIVAYSLQKR